MVMISLWLKIRQERTIGRAGSGSELAIFKTAAREVFIKNGTFEQRF